MSVPLQEAREPDGPKNSETLEGMGGVGAILRPIPITIGASKPGHLLCCDVQVRNPKPCAPRSPSNKGSGIFVLLITVM
jgi:hypothetical protein